MVIDLNTVRADELSQIEGWGEKLAEQIVQYREENGDFGSLEDVKNIPGFFDELVEVLRAERFHLV